LIGRQSKPIIQDHKLIVGFVFENSPASDCGLEVGNQILSLNGIDFSNISEEQYCELIIEKRYQKEYSEINLQWQNQDGLIKSSILRQIDLLSN
jgi:predicted metalloprotease with PDZ domain